MSDEYLLIYNHRNLQNENKWINSFTTDRNSIPIDVQRLPIARGVGSVLVNTKREEKQINLKGRIISDITETNNLQERMESFDSIFNTDDSLLSIFPEHTELVDTTSTASVNLFGDFINLGLNTTEFELSTASLQVDLDVSATAFTSGLIEMPATYADLSSIYNNGNFGFFVYLPRLEEITFVDFELTFGGGNTLKALNITTTYDNRAIRGGYNFFIVPSSNLVASGTATYTNLSKVGIRVNYNSGQTDMNGIRFGGVFWENSDRERNYKCTPLGSINKEGNYYNNTYTDFDLNLLNYTGYAEELVSTSVISQTSITGTTNTQYIELEGSMDPAPDTSIYINSTTNLGTLSIKNLDTSEQIDFLPSSITAGDTITFNPETGAFKNGIALDFNGTIPQFTIGPNSLQLILTPTGTTTISQTNFSSGYLGLSSGNTATWRAQAFTPAANATLQQVQVYGYCSVVGFSGVGNVIKIYSDNSNTPGTLLQTSSYAAFPTGTPGWITFTGLNLSVTNGTKYWIVMDMYYESFIGGGGGGLQSTTFYWGYTTTNPYAGGSRITSLNSGSSWAAAVAGDDHTFIISTSPAPVYNLNWSMSYKRRYA